MYMQFFFRSSIGFAFVLSALATLRAEEPPASAPPAAAVPAVELDKTYRLEFKLVTSETSQSYVVLTSQSVFALRYGARKDGDDYSLDIAGTLVPRQNDDRLRVSFKIKIDRNDDNGDGFDLSSTGSAIIGLRKSKIVANYGGYELRLTVTTEEDSAGESADKDPPATKDN